MKPKSQNKEGVLAKIFGGLRSGKPSMSPTTETIEKHMTTGPLAERTDYYPGDLVGVAYLEYIAKTYRIPEAQTEAEIWRSNFISRGRMGRLENVEMIKAKIQSELELAKVKAATDASLGRERK